MPRLRHRHRSHQEDRQADRGDRHHILPGRGLGHLRPHRPLLHRPAQQSAPLGVVLIIRSVVF